MESSPLIKAHDFARAAAEATRNADSSVAVSKHAQAAGEFSSAAASTSSIEALRTLQLLEQHHRKLSELLRFPHEQHATRQSAGTEQDEEPAAGDKKHGAPADGGPSVPEKLPAKGSTGPPTPASSAVAPKPVPTLPHQSRRPTRELSSSIASNLASARGIRSKYRGQGQPLVPSVSNEQAPGSLEVHPRADSPTRTRSVHRGPPPSERPAGGQPSWVPPAPSATAAPPRAKTGKAVSIRSVESPAPASPADEGFSRFYNTFGSIINRLSAPLAFAGLPLIAEESSPPAPAPSLSPPLPPASDKSSPHHKKQQHRARGAPPATTATAGGTESPELSKIYSKAALRAMRGDAHGPNDSFYVVPTTGHTVSYANILTFDQKERRRLAASDGGRDNENGGDENDDDDDDDFIDAAESPPIAPSRASSVSPGARRKQRGGRPDKEVLNAMEELSLENKSLKEMLDKLSRRLHAFELNSQSSHLALAQSLRLQRPGSPMSSSGGGGTAATGGGGGGGGGGEDALRKRNRDLEEQLVAATKQMDALEKDYGKVQQTVEKYRDRWEKLKAGAKARREAQGSMDNGGGGSSRPAR